MKKALLFCSVMILSLSIVPLAHSENDIYASLMLGATQPLDSEVSISGLGNLDDIEWDVGFSAVVAAGKDFGLTRLEGEIGYQINNITDSSSDLSIFSVLLNCYFDIEMGGPVTPYLTAGLGLAGAKIKDTDTDTESDNDAVVAYQLGAGINFALNDTTSLDLRYRYFATSEMEFDTLDVEFASHVVFFGINKRF